MTAGLEPMDHTNALTSSRGDRIIKKWKFSELLADPAVRGRWEKVRKFFFLRESTYDMTTRCNIRCDGCYYFEGPKQFAPENGDPEAWQKLMQEEKKRGITYAVLAGAEPSLVPDIMKVCSDEMPLGCIATNGMKRIPESIGYQIHISVWGNDATSLRIRKAKNMLRKQIDNYRDDPRAVFVYTFTRENLDEASGVVETVARDGGRITFNVFSAPLGYAGPLRHSEASLNRTRQVMVELMESYPGNVIFSCYSATAHTHRYGLHALFGCTYPRMNRSEEIGLGRSFRQYRADLTWDREAACCVPDTDCLDCRHYAAGSAVVTARLHRHATDPDIFRSWLDYVDTYLAVWVRGYEKSDNLCGRQVNPPWLSA